MNKHERELMIEKLQAEIDASTIEIAQRRQARILDGDTSDLDLRPRQPVVTKKAAGDAFDVHRAVADQVWQRQQRQQPQEPPKPFVVDDGTGLVGILADEIGTMTGKMAREIAVLRCDLDAARADIETLNSIIRGSNVTALRRGNAA